MEQFTEKNCSLCGHEVSNPVCVDCLRKQIIGFVGTNLKQDVDENMQLFEGFEDSKTKCVFCDAPVFICSYCFYREIYKVLKLSNPRFAKKFGRLFQCSGEMQTFLNHYFSFSLEVT
ncbi:hypothetical protein K8R33_04550 [archaeon]|nr:hypothetical protein [archaeon]